MYWPLRYIETVKRPGGRYTWRIIIQEEYVFWVLAATWLSGSPLWHAAGLFLLLLSFWTIYEHGYVENDWVAYNFEGEQGKVPEALQTSERPPEWPPWIWAFVLAVPGVAMLGLAAGTPLTAGFWLRALGGWVLLLALTRLFYLLYNHLVPASRIIIYPLLQACRGFGVLAATAASVIGLLLLTAHTLARSMPYLLYRMLGPAGRTRWPEMPVAFMRLFLFLLMWLAYAVARREPTVLIDAQAWLIVAWCLFRTRGELPDMVGNLRKMWLKY